MLESVYRRSSKGEPLFVEISSAAFTPAPPNTPPPVPANVMTLNLIDNIERPKLSVDRILLLHGRVVPVTDLYAAAGRSPVR